MPSLSQAGEPGISCVDILVDQEGLDGHTQLWALARCPVGAQGGTSPAVSARTGGLGRFFGVTPSSGCCHSCHREGCTPPGTVPAPAGSAGPRATSCTWAGTIPSTNPGWGCRDGEKHPNQTKNPNKTIPKMCLFCAAFCKWDTYSCALLTRAFLLVFLFYLPVHFPLGASFYLQRLLSFLGFRQSFSGCSEGAASSHAHCQGVHVSPGSSLKTAAK